MTLDRIVRSGHAGRRSFLSLRALAQPDQSFNIQILQTSASIENALANAYDTLLGLPVLAGTGANPVLKSLISNAYRQHTDHATACNDLASRLGGRAQNGANATVAQIGTRARAGDLASVIDVALQMETIAAETYQNHVALLTDVNARRLAASILHVEAEHVGLLGLMKALVNGRLPELVSLDAGVVGRLPPEVAAAAAPDSFSTTDLARPPAEGAIR